MYVRQTPRTRTGGFRKINLRHPEAHWRLRHLAASGDISETPVEIAMFLKLEYVDRIVYPESGWGRVRCTVCCTHVVISSEGGCFYSKIVVSLFYCSITCDGIRYQRINVKEKASAVGLIVISSL